ncbi:MAG: glycoside hydrolase family 172 protein [Planctomycetota bacterium]
MYTVFAAAALAFCWNIQNDAPKEITKEVTFDKLVTSLADLNWLAETPTPGEKCIQFSSYDRASHKDSKDDAGWFANNDAGQFIREEKVGDRIEYVMADVDGPGAVVRIWSANANDAGDLRFYFDNEKEASFTIPFVDLAGGTKAPFIEPFCGVHARGWNCYIPFPFAKHLKITASKKGFYYQVNIRQFGHAATVKSFSKELLLDPILKKTATRLLNDQILDGLPIDSFAVGKSVSLPAGGSKTILRPSSGVVNYFTLTPGNAMTRNDLRSLRIQILFDGSDQPAVDCPFVDFFGTAPDFVKYKTYVIGIDGAGSGYCKFPMPYQNGAVFRFLNEGATAVQFEYRIGNRDSTDDDVKIPPLRFHAKYIQKNAIKTQPRSDYLILDADGPGRFVGCSLMVRNPVRVWWGEGDEHIFVDGESFPSTFGTGTEDYFGYAWCDPTPFSAAFHSQSRCDGPGNRGFTSVNRFHIGDSIPFQKILKFDMEVWHWANTEVDYSSVAYWYAPANAKDRMPPLPPAKERLVRELPAAESKYKDSFEGEALLKTLTKTGGGVMIQDMAGFGEHWSREEQLWWTGAKPGDQLDLPFDTKELGAVTLRAQLTKAADYGIVQFLLDGVAIGQPFDGYNNGVVASGDIEIGRAHLGAGKHTLSIKITGANPKAFPQHMVGIDYFRIAQQ